MAKTFNTKNTKSPIKAACRVNKKEPIPYDIERERGGIFLIEINQPNIINNIPIIPRYISILGRFLVTFLLILLDVVRKLNYKL